MTNNTERTAVTAGLGCACGLGVLTAVMPVAGYVLLGLLGLGLTGLIAAGARLWWTTGYRPDDQPAGRTRAPAAEHAYPVWQEGA